MTTVELLADALGRLVVALGGVSDVPMTGPQLLLAAEDAIKHVDALRESGLLNDQRYETVGVVIRYDVPNREIVLDDLGALPMPKLGSSVFRKVDVPGETP